MVVTLRISPLDLLWPWYSTFHLQNTWKPRVIQQGIYEGIGYPMVEEPIDEHLRLQ